MTGKQMAAGAIAVVIAAGAYGYYKSIQEPTGPGSGEEMEVGDQTGPGSGDELAPGETNEPTGPGSGDEMAQGETNEPTGPGSGDELQPGETNEPTGPGSGDELPNNEAVSEEAGPGSGEEAKPSLGSCNIITTHSTCADYIGSFWDRKDAELNCGYEGAYSENPCPGNSLGGCQINVDTEFDMIVWNYTEGPGGFTAEVVPYSSAACQASGGNWVNP